MRSVHILIFCLAIATVARCQALDLGNGWKADFEVDMETDTVVVHAAVPCDHIIRDPTRPIVVEMVVNSHCSPWSHERMALMTEELDTVQQAWRRSSCFVEEGETCCNKQCLNTLLASMHESGAVTSTWKIAGCAQDHMLIDFSVHIHDLEEECGSNSEDGFPFVHTVSYIPQGLAILPVHGSLFYSASPSMATSELMVGSDTLLLRALNDASSPSEIPFDTALVTADITAHVKKAWEGLSNPDVVLSFEASMVLKEADDVFRTYSGAFSVGTESVRAQGHMEMQIVVFLRGGVRHWRISDVRATLMPGSGYEVRMTISKASESVLVEMAVPEVALVKGDNQVKGGDVCIFTLVSVDSGEVNGAVTPSVLVGHARDVSMQKAVEAAIRTGNFKALQRIQLLSEEMEIALTPYEGVRSVIDPSMPEVKRIQTVAMLTVTSAEAATLGARLLLPSDRSFVDVSAVPWTEDGEMVHCEDAEEGKQKCSSLWNLSGEFTLNAVEDIVGSYNLPYIVYEKPTGKELLEGTVTMETGDVEEEVESFLSLSVTSFQDQERQVPYFGDKPLDFGDVLYARACVMDAMTGAILHDALSLNLVSVYLETDETMCRGEEDEEFTASRMPLLNRNVPSSMAVQKGLDPVMERITDSATSACSDFHFTIKQVFECNAFTVGFNYLIRPIIDTLSHTGHAPVERRDVHVTLQTTNGTEAIIVVTENGNTGAVNLTLDGTEGFQQEVLFDFTSSSPLSSVFDDDDSTTTTTSPTSSDSSSSSSSSSSPSGKKKSVFVRDDDEGDFKKVTTVRFDDDDFHSLSGSSSSSSNRSYWGVFLVLFFVLLIIAAVLIWCFMPTGTPVMRRRHTKEVNHSVRYKADSDSDTDSSSDEEIEYIRREKQTMDTTWGDNMYPSAPPPEAVQVY